MVGFLLFGTVFTLLIVVGGVITWGRAARTGEAGSARRTRSEAREIQTRFEADDDFARNFQRPTQNEVLEALQMLDHLSPGWDQGGDALVDRRLKNELAESFPTLQKARCVYPQDLAADSAQGSGKKARDQAARTMLARQKFRAERAQANALHQLTSGPEVGPVTVTPGSLPFRVTENPQAKRTATGAKALALVTIGLGFAACAWYFAARKQPEPRLLAPIVPTGQAKASVSLPPVEAAPRESTSTRSPADIPALTTFHENIAQGPTAPAPSLSPGVVEATPPPAVAEVPSPPPFLTPNMIPPKGDTALAEGIAASKERAVELYPDLAVPNSEMNIRFVFRYKALLAEKSARLQDPGWPEKLADECARAANGTTKPKKTTLATPKPH